MNKYLLTILSSVALTILFSNSCNQSTPTQESQSVEQPDFKVAMLIPESIDDGTWSQSGYEGLRLVEQELGAEITYTEHSSDKSEAELQAITRQYIQDGYDFVVGHGGEFDPVMQVVAEEFPRTKFAVVGGDLAGNNKNLGNLSIRQAELGYLAGTIAAIKTKNQKVAYVGGVPYDSLVDEASSFELAAQTINPDILVKVEWTEDWNIASEVAQALATDLAEQGFDVWALDGTPGTDAMHAVAEQHGVKVIEWNQDVYDVAPNVIITSMIIDLPKMVLKGATLAQQGRWEGQRYELGFADNIFAVAPFRGTLTPEQEQQVEAVKLDIISGKIDPTR